MSSTSHRRPPSTRAVDKTVLVCPACGHESAHDGDWTVDQRAVGEEVRIDYDCPECGTTVVSQPVFA